jgi:outer membrane protein, heavy metal efflux system
MSFARLSLLSALLAGVVLSCGCVRYQPRPIALDQTAAALDSRSLANSDLRQFLSTNLGREFAEWPLKTVDFETLTWVAFYYHPSLDVARAQWAVATAGRKTAAGRPNPTVTVAPGYNFNAANAVSPWIPSGSFDVPIETMGKRAKRISRAEHLAKAARLNIATAAWQVRSALRAAMIDGATAERRRTLLQQQFDAQQAIGRLLEQRLAVGNASALDVSVARVPLVKLQAELAAARRIEAESRARLAEAIGVPARAVETLSVQYPISPDAEPLPTSEQARRGALQHRADVLSALAAYEASQANLQVEIARQYPDLHLGSGYQWDQGENKWNLSLSLELPILNRNQGPIAEAEARRKEAAAQLLALQARIIAEIDRASASQQATRAQLNEVQRVREALRERLQLVEARLTVGGADQLEFQAAKTELSASELTLLDAEVKSAQAAGQLEDALQIPFQALSVIERERDWSAKKD